MAIEITETSRGRVLHFTQEYKTSDNSVMVDRRSVLVGRIVSIEELGGDPMIVCEHNYFFRVKDSFAEIYAAVYG